MSPDERRFQALKTRINVETRNLTKIEARLQRYLRLLDEVKTKGGKESLIEEADVGVLIGAVLDDWYHAAEGIFKMIAAEIDGGIPSGESWHKQLVIQVSQEIPGVRPPVVTERTASGLDELRKFRHVFRNVYGFSLETVKVRKLAKKLPGLSEAFKDEIDRFCRKMNALFSAAED